MGSYIDSNEPKSVLIYVRIAKPCILPLQMFASITFNTTCSQNSRNNRRNLAVLAAPVVAYSEKSIKAFLMQIQKCIDLHMDRQTLYFTVANYCLLIFTTKKLTFMKKDRLKTGDTEGNWRPLSSPIVENICIFFM